MNTPVSVSISQLLGSHPIVSNLWPLALGVTAGDVVALSGQWAYPTVVGIMTGAIVQLIIALMRNSFSERRDVMTALREMIKERDANDRRKADADMVIQAENRRIRHELANMASRYRLEAAMRGSKMAMGDGDLYDIAAEEVAETKRRSIIEGDSGESH